MSNSLWSHGLYSPCNCPGQNTGLGCYFLLQGIFPTQGLNPGLPHCTQILYQLNQQGSPRILEWVAYFFSSGSSWPRKQTGSPALQVDSLPADLPGKPWYPIIFISYNVLSSWASKLNCLYKMWWRVAMFFYSLEKFAIDFCFLSL